MKYFYIFFLVILSICAFCADENTFDPNLSPVPYGYSMWQEDGYGNHRAVVEVNEPGENVLAHIEWRRFDNNPEKKAVIVFNEKGEKVSSFVVNINKIFGDIVFEGKEKGKYYIYYMPYISSNNYHIGITEYFPCENINKNFDINNLPKAKVLEIQSLIEKSTFITQGDYSKETFNSMYPMQITVSDTELNEFKNKYSDRNYVVFCEDRTNPIKMLNEIPYKWYKQGEIDSFIGTAQPNEIYTFQIGVYALKDIKDLKVSYDFPFELHCINTGGINYKGNPFTKTVNIAKGGVQPLWFYVRMGDNGEYKGSVTIEGNGETKLIPINIKVDGEYLKDGGVSESWRMSRISWLDSKKGCEDTVVSPYTFVEYKDNTVKILNREIKLNDLGFPVSIKSNNINILNKSIKFGIYENGKELSLQPVSKK